MARKTKIQEARERIQELKARRQSELDRLERARKEALEKVARADKAMLAAIERTDLDAYSKATRDREKAQTAADLYKARADQIRAKSTITEAESDSFINGLVKYEDQLAADFRKTCLSSLRALADAYRAYMTEVEELEAILNEWTREIHPNHIIRNGALYDPNTGGYTDRSPAPVPVHGGPYAGCDEALALEKVLAAAVKYELLSQTAIQGH